MDNRNTFCERVGPDFKRGPGLKHLAPDGCVRLVSLSLLACYTTRMRQKRVGGKAGPVFLADGRW